MNIEIVKHQECRDCEENERYISEIHDEIQALKQSSDELLSIAAGYLSYVRKNPDDCVSEEVIPIIQSAIQKAEALKEK